ncbi:MAG: serine/threonine-protein kinase, partial [Planctomycetota bacterium]
MSYGKNDDAADEVRRALSLLETFRARQREGKAEELDEFLQANAPLRAVLETLLAAQALQRDPSEPSGTFANYLLPRPGHEFGVYHLEERLGHGASGTVFLATDTKLGRRVALKILHPELLADRRGRDRFWREIRAASVLDHPNICAIYDSGVIGSVPFLSMRYVAGDTLAARIAKARDARALMVGFGGAALARAGTTPALGSTPVTAELTPGSRGSIEALLLRFEQLALALHYVHQQGFVHRDVKPANIMLDESDVPVLLDFGLARATVGASSMGPSVDAGTPMYLAPEQVAGTAAPGPAADLYALGVTLYECATLRHPFAGTTQNELFDAILHRTPVPARQWNPKLPRDLQVALAKATDKDPERRYATALAFAEDLRRIRQFQPILARPVSRVVRVERWVRRNRLAAAFFVIATAATVVSSFLFATFVRDRGRLELQATRALIEIAEVQAEILLPASPEKLPALRAFSERFEGSESLEDRLHRVRAAKVALEQKARPASASDRLASRQYRDYLQLVESLRIESEARMEIRFDTIVGLVQKAKDLLTEHFMLITPSKARMLYSLLPTFERRREALRQRVHRLESELGLVAAFAFDSPEEAREH